MKDYIFEKRESLGLSIRTFSKLIGYSYQTVSDWEKGKHIPTMNAVLKIIHRLKLKEDEEAELWKAHARSNEKRPPETRGRKPIKTKSIREVPGWIDKLNKIGDLPPVHPNDPRLQSLRVALGDEPIVKEHASLMESYLRHKERSKKNETKV